MLQNGSKGSKLVQMNEGKGGWGEDVGIQNYKQMEDILKENCIGCHNNNSPPTLRPIERIGVGANIGKIPHMGNIYEAN